MSDWGDEAVLVSWIEGRHPVTGEMLTKQATWKLLRHPAIKRALKSNIIEGVPIVGAWSDASVFFALAECYHPVTKKQLSEESAWELLQHPSVVSALKQRVTNMSPIMDNGLTEQSSQEKQKRQSKNKLNDNLLQPLLRKGELNVVKSIIIPLLIIWFGVVLLWAMQKHTYQAGAINDPALRRSLSTVVIPERAKVLGQLSDRLYSFGHYSTGKRKETPSLPNLMDSLTISQSISQSVITPSATTLSTIKLTDSLMPLINTQSFALLKLNEELANTLRSAGLNHLRVLSTQKNEEDHCDAINSWRWQWHSFWDKNLSENLYRRRNAGGCAVTEPVVAGRRVAVWTGSTEEVLNDLGWPDMQTNLSEPEEPTSRLVDLTNTQNNTPVLLAVGLGVGSTLLRSKHKYGRRLGSHTLQFIPQDGSVKSNSYSHFIALYHIANVEKGQLVAVKKIEFIRLVNGEGHVLPLAHKSPHIVRNKNLKSKLSDSGTKATTKPMLPMFPANDLEVHALSVYNGYLGDDVERNFRAHSERRVQVTVERTDKPIMLMLSAYESVHWDIKLKSGAKLKQVLAVGYHQQRVTLPGTSDAIVTIPKQLTVSKNKLRLKTQGQGNHAFDIRDSVKRITGASLHTFQGDYSAKKFYAINSMIKRFQTSNFTKNNKLVTPVDVALIEHSDLHWWRKRDASDGKSRGVRSWAPRESGGWFAQRKPVGATTAWVASEPYASGKYYLEATVRKTGDGVSTYGNIQLLNVGVNNETQGVLLLRENSKKMLADGGVVGLAIDLDSSRIYYSYNGFWGKKPGEMVRENKKLLPEREYTPSFISVGDGLPNKLEWQVNFGATPFKYKPPSGYLTYNGSQLVTKPLSKYKEQKPLRRSERNKSTVTNIKTQLMVDLFARSQAACDQHDEELFLDLFSQRIKSRKRKVISDEYMMKFCRSLMRLKDKALGLGLGADGIKVGVSYGLLEYNIKRKGYNTRLCVYGVPDNNGYIDDQCHELFHAIIDDGNLKYDEN